MIRSDRILPTVLLTALTTGALPVFGAQPAESQRMTVYKSPSCGCCEGWIAHLERNGFDVRAEDTHRINAIKQENNLPREMASCHTALIDGYVIEGHVPADDIHAFLDAEEHALGDDTLGLAVPRMPHGSPGMQTGRQDDFSVFAFTADGRTKVTQSYIF